MEKESNYNNDQLNSQSLGLKAWKRLKKNRLAMFGLYYIAFLTIVALLGSFIRPDKTPDAVLQHPSIAFKKPGFDVKMLHVRKNEVIESTPFYSRFLWYGKANKHIEIPIGNFKFNEDATVFSYQKYEERPSDDKPWIDLDPIKIAYALDTSRTLDKGLNGALSFYDLQDGKIETSYAEIREKILLENIPATNFALGTDGHGRDYLSRVMTGAVVSLLVGFISVAISLILGLTLGAVAGYFRGWVDGVIMWLINVVWSIPTLLMVIAIIVGFGKGFVQVFIAIGLTMWVEVARIVRGQILSVRESNYVEAGKAMGFSPFRIIFRHILPNIMGPVIVISAANFAAAILIEAGLSFLGVGAQSPMASWGEMLSTYKWQLDGGRAYLPIVPGLMIMITVLAFMLVGNGLRDALDIKSEDDNNLSF